MFRHWNYNVLHNNTAEVVLGMLSKKLTNKKIIETGDLN